MSCARRPAHRATLLVALVVAAVGSLVAGCGTEVASEPLGAIRPTQTSIHPIPVVPTSDTAAATTPTSVASIVIGADGVALPDPSSTPGAVFPDVREVDVCAEKYKQGVRNLRHKDEVAAFALFGLTTRDRDEYRLDHLVPILLGGSNELANLWPQPTASLADADAKDRLESRLHGLVCSGQLSLADAQNALKSNWWSAYATFMAEEVPDSAKPPTNARVGGVIEGETCEPEGSLGVTAVGVTLRCTAADEGLYTWQKRY